MVFSKCNLVRRLALGLVVSASLLGGQAQALEPEHEVRRLMLATENAVKSKSWGEAGEYLNRLQALKAQKPADYLFFRGRVMYESAHYNEARSSLEGYVSAAGAEGSHYQEALQLITDIEKALKENAANRNHNGEKKEPVAVIEPAGQETLEHLRQLYLVDSDVEALKVHLNSLLELSGWRADQRIVRVGSPPDVGYQVDISGNEIRIREARRDGEEQVLMATHALPVYGVNPQVRWNCEPSTSTCWVYDPRDGSRLFQLAHDRSRAAEVARTLGRLIKTLQAPS